MVTKQNANNLLHAKFAIFVGTVLRFVHLDSMLESLLHHQQKLKLKSHQNKLNKLKQLKQLKIDPNEHQIQNTSCNQLKKGTNYGRCKWYIIIFIIISYLLSSIWQITFHAYDNVLGGYTFRNKKHHNHKKRGLISIPSIKNNNNNIMNDHSLYLSEIPYFVNDSIAIIGMVSNAESTIEHILTQLNSISCIFNNTIFILFESNSNDNTYSILNSWSYRTRKHYIMKCKRNKYHPDPRRNHLNHTYHYNIIESFEPSLIRQYLLSGDELVQNKFNNYISWMNISSISNMSRVDRYIIYRNFLLSTTKNISANLNINFDYLMIIDLDLNNLYLDSIFRELKVSKSLGYNIMCAQGITSPFDPYLYDSFAVVTEYDEWKWTNNTDIEDRESWRKIFVENRFQKVHSCFGGLTIYSDFDKIWNSKCHYYYTKDILLNNHNICNNGNYNGTWCNKVQKLIKNAPPDLGMCEHIPFHYCLIDNDYNIAIARDATIWYYDRQSARKRQQKDEQKRNNTDINKNNNLLI